MERAIEESVSTSLDPAQIGTFGGAPQVSAFKRCESALALDTLALMIPVGA